MLTRLEKMNRRSSRVRFRLRRENKGRLRLSVFRTNLHIYAQIIDDVKGHTLVAASSLDKELRVRLPKGSNVEAAAEIGKVLAERAKKAGISQVVFDRGAYLYHGRVKSLAMGARAGGLEF